MAVQIPLEPRLTPDGAHRFLLPVAIGTPAQDVMLALDTGSPFLLLSDLSRGVCLPDEATQCFNSTASKTLEHQHLGESHSQMFHIDGNASALDDAPPRTLPPTHVELHRMRRPLLHELILDGDGPGRTSHCKRA